MARLTASFNVFRSIGLNPLNTDSLILHALDVIGAISCISGNALNKSKIDSTKLRIFWKTIQSITCHQLDEINDKEVNRSYQMSSIDMVLTAFPGKQKSTVGRIWSPMHWAVVVPGVELEEIRVLLTDQPKQMAAFSTFELPCSQNKQREISVEPCHLAVMTKTPNMDFIQHLKMFDRNFGTLLASNGSTTLHLAAEYSNSVALIKQLIQLNPKALEIRNLKDEIPLCCVSRNRFPEAPEILRSLIDAAPHTVTLPYNGNLPLHLFLNLFYYDRECDDVDATIKSTLVLILLQSFPESANIPNNYGWLPIHMAAQKSSVDILRIITEANPEHLSATVPTIGSVAHCAVERMFSENALYANCTGAAYENVRYIHSIIPELFHTLNDSHQTPLHLIIHKCHSKIEEMVTLVPETARILDLDGNSLLHTLAKSGGLTDTLARLLLRLIPGGALATNNQGQTPYDMPNLNLAYMALTRRLLLLAGAPSLHPETRQQMNYQARKGALFAFFAGALKSNIFYRIRDSGTGIVLMRQVVSFL